MKKIALANLDSVKANSAIDEQTGCWVWQGTVRTSRKADGKRDVRGIVTVGGVKHYVYRVAWHLRHGQPFPEGKVARHVCDNPLCVNPDHILPGTDADNADDAARRGRYRTVLTDAQVKAVLDAAASLGPAAGYQDVADAVGDPGIHRWTVRDVLDRGQNLRRLAERGVIESAHVVSDAATEFLSVRQVASGAHAYALGVAAA